MYTVGPGTTDVTRMLRMARRERELHALIVDQDQSRANVERNNTLVEPPDTPRKKLPSYKRCAKEDDTGDEVVKHFSDRVNHEEGSEKKREVRTVQPDVINREETINKKRKVDIVPSIKTTINESFVKSSDTYTKRDKTNTDMNESVTTRFRPYLGSTKPLLPISYQSRVKTSAILAESSSASITPEIKRVGNIEDSTPTPVERLITTITEFDRDGNDNNSKSVLTTPETKGSENIEYCTLPSREVIDSGDGLVQNMTLSPQQTTQPTIIDNDEKGKTVTLFTKSYSVVIHVNNPETERVENTENSTPEALENPTPTETERVENAEDPTTPEPLKNPITPTKTERVENADDPTTPTETERVENADDPTTPTETERVENAEDPTTPTETERVETSEDCNVSIVSTGEDDLIDTNMVDQVSASGEINNSKSEIEADNILAQSQVQYSSLMASLKEEERSFLASLLPDFLHYFVRGRSSKR